MFINKRTLRGAFSFIYAQFKSLAAPYVCGNFTYGIMSIWVSHSEERSNLLTSEATGMNEVRKELRSELQGTPTFNR